MQSYEDALQSFLGYGEVVRLRPAGRSGTAPTIREYLEGLPLDAGGEVVLPRNLIFEVDEAHRMTYAELSALMSLSGDDGRDNALVLAGYTKELNELFEGGPGGKKGDKGLLRRIGNRVTLNPMDDHNFLAVMKNVLSQYDELEFSDEDLLTRIRTDPDIQAAHARRERRPRRRDGVLDRRRRERREVQERLRAAGGKFHVPSELVRGPRRQMTRGLRSAMTHLREIDGMEDAGGRASSHLHGLLNDDRERKGYPPLDASGREKAWRPRKSPSSRPAEPLHGMLAVPPGFTGRELFDEMGRGLLRDRKDVTPDPVYLTRSQLVDSLVEGTGGKVETMLRQLDGRFVVIDVQELIEGGPQGKDAHNHGRRSFRRSRRSSRAAGAVLRRRSTSRATRTS